MSDTPLHAPVDAESLERAVALLTRLTGASSDSGDLDGLRSCAELIGGELRRRGFEVALERDAESGDRAPTLVARTRSTGRAPLLLLGHYDTVLAATPSRRTSEGDRGRLVATGAIDMKGGIATLLAALDRLAAAGAGPPDDLLVVLVPDEEVAGAISKRATARFGSLARACFVLEPGELRADAGETIVVGRRGLANFRLEATGRSAHSGLAFHSGRSAVAAAARWIAAAAALSRSGDGPTVNLSRVVGGDRSMVDGQTAVLDLFGSERLLNVVADRALVEGEYRYRSRADRDSVRAELERLAREVGSTSEVELELTFGTTIEPVDPTPARLELAQRAVGLARELGFRLEIELDRGGISFPNFLPAGLDLPVLDGLGPAGGGMHTRDEFVDLRSFARRIALLAALLDAERG